jgi:hypothetical protein
MRILGSSNHALVIEVSTNPGARRYANPLARILDPGSFRQSNHGMLRCDVGTSRDVTHTGFGWRYGESFDRQKGCLVATRSGMGPWSYGSDYLIGPGER